MKVIALLVMISSFSAFAVEHVCAVNVVSRDTGKTIKMLKGHSKYGLDRACNWAKTFCQEAIEDLDAEDRLFCLKKGKMPFGFDGRIRPAQAYFRGEVKRVFKAVCYGKDYQEAKEYCRENTMTACATFIRNTKEYGWYCSFQ